MKVLWNKIKKVLPEFPNYALAFKDKTYCNKSVCMIIHYNSLQIKPHSCPKPLLKVCILSRVRSYVNNQMKIFDSQIQAKHLTHSPS